MGYMIFGCMLFGYMSFGEIGDTHNICSLYDGPLFIRCETMVPQSKVQVLVTDWL